MATSCNVSLGPKSRCRRHRRRRRSPSRRSWLLVFAHVALFLRWSVCVCVCLAIVSFFFRCTPPRTQTHTQAHILAIFQRCTSRGVAYFVRARSEHLHSMHANILVYIVETCAPIRTSRVVCDRAHQTHTPTHALSVPPSRVCAGRKIIFCRWCIMASRAHARLWCGAQRQEP